jgi:glycosyltransferase involved in cell wall biosynthesis
MITCVSAHSWTVLPMTVKIAAANGCPWIYEPHELETDTSGLGWRGRVRARKTESRYIRAAAAVVVVSDGIADWYKQRYQIPRPTVVRNIPRLALRQPVQGLCLRQILKIPDDDLVFLYQGLLTRNRGLERLLEIFKSAETSRHLVFLGNGPLSQIVEAASRERPNIHRLPAVPIEELLGYTSSADIGIVSGQSSCLSHYYSLPNKFFEYIQAGIPVLASDFPEMRAVIEKIGCGWVVPDSTAAWKQGIQSISIGAVQEAKRKAVQAACEFSWDEEAAKLVSVYQRLTQACIAPASTARGLRGQGAAGGGSTQDTDRQKSDISSP